MVILFAALGTFEATSPQKQTFRVSGSVVGRGTAAVQPRKIALKPQTKGAKAQSAPINTDGSFVFSTVPPGIYEMRFDPSPDRGLRAIRVVSSDLSDVAVPVFIPTFEVLGRFPSENELKALGFLPPGTALGRNIVLENMDPGKRSLEAMKVTRPEFETVRPGYFEPKGRIQDEFSRKGDFEFRDVPAGIYSLSFSRAEVGLHGCCALVRTGIVITVQDRSVDLGTVRLNPAVDEIR
jgi:hypothetical protein